MSIAKLRKKVPFQVRNQIANLVPQRTSDMIKHIVMWKLKPEAEGHTAKENASWMKEHLEALLGTVPELKSCHVGINIGPEDNCEACLESTFESMEDLGKYKVHPEHVKVSSYCKLVRESRVACDFEI